LTWKGSGYFFVLLIYMGVSRA